MTNDQPSRSYGIYASPLGAVYVVASEGGVHGVYFEGQKYFPPKAELGRLDPAHAVVAQCIGQLDDYFAGRRATFDLPLAPEGTSFAHRVWRELARIKTGTTATYGDVARRLGIPAGSRAVGAATGRNPISIIIPCHRLIGATGQLTGYAGGLDRKERLLALEGRRSLL